MEFDKKESSSYLDGVPLTIGAKFCPPRSVSLPLAFTSCFPLDLLEEEYDFSLEKKVLEAAAKEKALEEESVAKAKEEKVSSEIQNFAQGSSQKSSNEQPTNQNTCETSTKNCAAAWKSVSILQPQLHHKPSENGSLQTEDNSKYINLSDFENDTSSPFDYMELQTINDFEALSTVFQGLNENKVSASLPKLPDKDNEGNSIYSSVNCSVPSSSICLESKNLKLGNFSKSSSFSSPQNSSFENFDKAACSSKDAICCDLYNKRLLTSSCELNSCNQLGSCSCATKPLDYEPVHDSKAKELTVNCGKTDDSFSVLHETHSTTIADVTCKHPLNQCSHLTNKSYGFLRCSKSVSDLCNMPVKESGSPPLFGRSHTPPPNIISSKHTFENSNAEEILAKNLLHDNQDNGTCTGLPDPYDELAGDEKLFVDSITDMGFLRSQVARTVKHLGADDKKVVEHLCQIQMLEEAGYDSLEAEAALHLHDYNRDEAKKYLDLLTQIQGLGFEKTAIKKALVQNKNDMDKAINALLL